MLKFDNDDVLRSRNGKSAKKKKAEVKKKNLKHNYIRLLNL